MKTIVIALLLTFSSGALSQYRTHFSRYRSWDSHMYPVWRDGDPRYRDCWTGGEVTFKVISDSPTLTGAKSTFNIDVQFPQNQTVLPDGQVVWARNCTINGTAYTMGQAVYPEPNIPQEWNGVFPDGTPFTKISNQKPRFIYVWKTWGKYWQVADGPSSLLTIDTDKEPVGSYTMEVVIYHCRGKDKFVPLGSTSVQFSITDQIPFAVTLSQVGDITQGDQSFIQNTAVSFSINLHDPSHYLSGSDITFNWDFGDNSGTLISRDTTVTHTYLTSGSFRPQVLLMAAILSDCTPDPSSAATGDPPASPLLTDEAAAVSVESVVMAEAAAADATVAANDLAVAPGTESDINAVAAQEVPTVAVPIAEAAVSAESVVMLEAAAADATVAANDLAVAPGTELDVNAVAAQDVPTVAVPLAEAAAVSAESVVMLEAAAADATVAANDLAVAPGTESDVNAVAAQDVPTVAVIIAEAAAVTIITTEPVAEFAVSGTSTSVPAPAEGDDVIINISATFLPESSAATVVIETAVPVNVLSTDVLPSVISAAEDTEINNGATAEANEATVIETAAELETVSDATQATLAIAKRQAPEMPAETCLIYRYGSFSTTIDVVQGIESVEIVEVNNVVVTELEQNAVDLTVTCEGSLPNQVCTVLSDADCISPVQTLCSAVTPTPECQMVLRQFFNDSGTFCINVSLTNDVSLAVTSAKVSVTVGTSSSRGTAGAALGLLLFICAVGAIAFTYKRFKHYHPVRADYRNSSRSSVSLMLWNLMRRPSTGESRPLLHERVV